MGMERVVEDWDAGRPHPAAAADGRHRRRPPRLRQPDHRPARAGRGRRARGAAPGDPRRRTLGAASAPTSRRCSTASAAAPASTRAPCGAAWAARPTARPTRGPIGAVLTPLLEGMEGERSSELPFLSSLCGSCHEACPVGIPLHDLLVRARGRVTTAEHLRERRLFRLWSRAWSSPLVYGANRVAGARRAAGRWPARLDQSPPRAGRRMDRRNATSPPAGLRDTPLSRRCSPRPSSRRRASCDRGAPRRSRRRRRSASLAEWGSLARPAGGRSPARRAGRARGPRADRVRGAARGPTAAASAGATCWAWTGPPRPGRDGAGASPSPSAARWCWPPAPAHGRSIDVVSMYHLRSSRRRG